MSHFGDDVLNFIRKIQTLNTTFGNVVSVYKFEFVTQLYNIHLSPRAVMLIQLQTDDSSQLATSDDVQSSCGILDLESTFNRRHTSAGESAETCYYKLVLGLRQLTYSDRLVALNLPSVLYRRRRIDMITVLRQFMVQMEYLLTICLCFITLSQEVMATNCLSNFVI